MYLRNVLIRYRHTQALHGRKILCSEIPKTGGAARQAASYKEALSLLRRPGGKLEQEAVLWFSAESKDQGRVSSLEEFGGGGLVAKLCLTLCDPMECSPPGSFSMRSPRQGYWTGLPFPSPGDLLDPGWNLWLLLGRQTLYHCTTWQAQRNLRLFSLNNFSRFHPPLAGLPLLIKYLVLG